VRIAARSLSYCGTFALSASRPAIVSRTSRAGPPPRCSIQPRSNNLVSVSSPIDMLTLANRRHLSVRSRCISCRWSPLERRISLLRLHGRLLPSFCVDAVLLGRLARIMRVGCQTSKLQWPVHLRAILPQSSHLMIPDRRSDRGVCRARYGIPQLRHSNWTTVPTVIAPRPTRQ
jgi:hypothetical protein